MSQYAPRVPHEEFVRIWQTSASAAEVIERTGLRKSAVYKRARQYRKHGVPLKQFCVRDGVDFGRLAQIARETA